MISKTRGIVLNYVKFKETSIITKIYTEEFGIQSYIVNGVRSSSGKSTKIAFFQPLTFLDLVVYYKENVNINRISELKCYQPFSSLPYNYKKSCIALFITEILIKTLKEEENNPNLFYFLQYAVFDLDKREKGLDNFPVIFLIRLSNYLGIHFQIEENSDSDVQIINNDNVLKKDLHYLMHYHFEATQNIHKKNREQIFNILIRYYQLHFGNFDKLNSLEVLRMIS